MSIPEFIVEFIKAYAQMVSALVWPLVTIVIFGTFIYYLDRTLNFFGRRKKQPLSWGKLENLIGQLEKRHLSLPASTDREERRRLLVCREIANAKEALAQRDQEKIQESLFAIGALALESDKNLPKWKAIEDNSPALNPELIFPDRTPNPPPSE
ncbi:MAG: hypothetical protein AB1656_24680 [Candidatus Omnitrophota bacterium]